MILFRGAAIPARQQVVSVSVLWKNLESIGYQEDNNIVYCTDQISSSISFTAIRVRVRAIRAIKAIRVRLGLLGLTLTLIALIALIALIVLTLIAVKK